jgi:hypothetical protein
VVHLARGPDVVVGGGDLELLRPQYRGGFIPGPGEVVAVVVQPDVGVLARRVAGLRVGGDLAHPADDPPGHLGVLAGAEEGEGIEIGPQQFGIVVGHLLEVGDDPLRVHTVAVEPAAELVVDTAPAHSLEGTVQHGPHLVGRPIPPAVEQELERRRMGKLRLGAEPSVPAVEDRGHAAHRLVQQRGRDLASRALVERRVHHPADGLRLGAHLVAPVAVRLEHCGEHRAEAGSAVTAIRREIGAAVEDLSRRREERRQRPTALPGEGLDRALVAAVHVRPLVTVDLDADEVLVEEARQLRVLVGLAVHHVTPVAPHGADIEQHGLVRRPRRGERLGAPGIPRHGLVRRGLEVGRGRVGQSVRCHAEKLPGSLPAGRDARPRTARGAHRSAPLVVADAEPVYLWLSEYT